MNKKLKILFVPIDGVGHMNACIGIAEVLREKGHRIIFAVNESWNGRLIELGFEEELMTEAERDPNEDPAKHWANIFDSCLKSATALEKAVNLSKNLIPLFANRMKNLNIVTAGIIDRIKPDVMILDQGLCIPSVVNSGIPWILSCSFNPLFFLDDEKTPPANSGLPAIGHEDQWKNFREKANEAVRETWEQFNQYIISEGLQPLIPYKFTNDSPYLNIYGFPLELDYLDLRPLRPKWARFDNLKRTDRVNHFEIPETLKNKSGKLIYFSMGSMGGANVELMRRLISILSKSPNRFIVSKGPLHEQYELPDNMWGEKTVSQLSVLSVVDLVITHGGNNTVTETFYFGKPIIVLPLFGDQYDNAQRIHEKGFGVRLDPHTCTEQQLLQAIEEVLNNKLLDERLKTISQRIQKDNSISKLPDLVQGLVRTS